MGEKKEENKINQEARDKIFREEMDKKKKEVVKRIYDFLGESGVTLYIILSSMLFGLAIPMYIVGVNPYIFEKAFGLSPIGVTGILALIGIIMFLGWLLFGALTIEIFKRKNKIKSKKKKKWWDI